MPSSNTELFSQRRQNQTTDDVASADLWGRGGEGVRSEGVRNVHNLFSKVTPGENGRIMQEYAQRFRFICGGNHMITE